MTTPSHHININEHSKLGFVFFKFYLNRMFTTLIKKIYLVSLLKMSHGSCSMRHA